MDRRSVALRRIGGRFVLWHGLFGLGVGSRLSIGLTVSLFVRVVMRLGRLYVPGVWGSVIRLVRLVVRSLGRGGETSSATDTVYGLVVVGEPSFIVSGIPYPFKVAAYRV